MSSARAGAFALVLPLLCGCDRLIQWWQVEQTLVQNEKVRAYSLDVEEKGLLATDRTAVVLSRIGFSHPQSYVRQILEPKPWSGLAVHFDGRTLFTFDPSSRTSLKISGLSPWTPEQYRRMVSEKIRGRRQTFVYRPGAKLFEPWNGYRLVETEFTAKGESQIVRSGRLRILAQYSVLVESESTFAGGGRYLLSARNVNLNEQAATFPTRAQLNGVNAEHELSLELSKSKVNATGAESWPRFLPRRFAQRAVARGTRGLEAVLYQRDATFVVVAKLPKGAYAWAPGFGIDVNLGESTRGRMQPSQELGVLAFEQSGRSYVVFSNSGLTELHQSAAAIAASESTGNLERSESAE